MYNPIILSQDEEPLLYLDPEKLDLDETSEKGKLRTISLSYPLDDEHLEENKRLFRVGNKIWIPDFNGVEAGLYIINSDYKYDYWDKNIISVDAEEILVELNYIDLFVQTKSTSVTVNRERLEEWFGSVFIIGEIDEFKNTDAQVISTSGTLTKMSLLRYIEEETLHVFRTRYVKDENTNRIHRYLDFKDPEKVGSEHDIVLDLNYNAENIEYEVSESDTYRAIAPILSVSQTDDNSTNTSVVGNNNSNVVTREDLAQIIQNWKNLGVKKGENIPMIVEKQTKTNENNETYVEEVRTAYWDAPFTKLEGQMYVIDDIDTNCEYNEIKPRPDYNEIKPTKYTGDDAINITGDTSETVDLGANTNINYLNTISPKIGTVSTSDTNVYCIYDDCALKLMEKRYPSVEIVVSTKDIEQITKEKNSFNVDDTVYVRVPGYDHLLKTTVTKTVKNPNLVGSNKITLQNIDVSGKIVQKATNIIADDFTVNYGKGEYVEAQLVDEEKNPIPDKNCSITIIKPDTQSTTEVLTTETTSTTTSDGYNQYGVSTDGSKIMAIGRPSASGEVSKYGYVFKKSVFVRKCPHCGSSELYWSIFWAGNETSNWGRFPATGNNEGGSAEGHIFCKKCDADYSCIDGKEHVSGGKTLSRVSGPTSSTKQEAYSLKNGNMKGTTVTNVVASTSTPTSSVDSIMKEASTITYRSPSCSPSCDSVEEGYNCVKKSRVADCFGMSAYLYKRLNDAGHKARIVVYYSQYAGSGTHRTVQVYENGSWVDPSYAGFSTLFKPMTTKKNMKVCKDAPATSSSSSTSTSTSVSSTTSTVAGYTTVYSKKTDENGIFKLQINLDKFDNYTIKFNFGGDIEYGRSTKSFKLIVQ